MFRNSGVVALQTEQPKASDRFGQDFSLKNRPWFAASVEAGLPTSVVGPTSAFAAANPGSRASLEAAAFASPSCERDHEKAAPSSMASSFEAASIPCSCLCDRM